MNNFKPLNGTEQLQIYGSSQLTTTAAIAALGGSGVTAETRVSNGNSVNVGSVGTFVGFNSNSATNKSVNLPKSTGSLGVVIISDLKGTAYNYPITAYPNGSDVIIGNQNQVYTNYGSITLLDTADGWASI